MNNLEKAKQNILLRESILSDYACKSSDAIFLSNQIDEENEIRSIFFRDIDRIIHSLGYARYIDKTQVFSLIKNDHITHRVLHVQLVSKIARTIGRSLRLNEDLIEAIALGHDIGHSPFGHNGERYLNDICIREDIGYFCHNGQSVRVLKDLEGLNISLQTLDGIIAHNGEILKNKYEHNINKSKKEFIEDLDGVFQIKDYSNKIVPKTMEASVVRLSDIIAYIGRDVEDSIKLGIIAREEIPESITKVLGNNNSQIVDILIKDIIVNSLNKPYLLFSDEIFEALMKLKDWNYKKIYTSQIVYKNQEIIQKLFDDIFYCYLEKSNKVIENNDKVSESEKNLLNFIMQNKKETNIKRIIIDYIAGQTDQYFLNECKLHLKIDNIEKLFI